MWGRQDAAILGDDLLIFSQFNRQSIYPFPLIRSDAKTVLDAIELIDALFCEVNPIPVKEAMKLIG